MKELNVKKGTKGFTRKRTSLEYSLLQCVWCNFKSLEDVIEKIEITDSDEKIDLVELRPSWNAVENNPYRKKLLNYVCFF